MRLKTLCEDDTATHYRNIIAAYLDDNLKDTLHHAPTSRNSLYVRIQPNIVSTESSAMMSVVASDSGDVTLTYYPDDMSKGCTVEKTNLHDPDSLPKILEFINRFDYET